MNKINLTVIAVILAVLLFAVNAFSQKIPSQNKLPVDETIKIGKLKNGFTYFIKKMKSKKTQVMLVVNAGKNLETPAQLGLAHVLEHLPFQETKSFKNAMTVFSGLGIERGNEFNAATANEYTNYEAQVSAGRTDILKRVLDFYRDCAGGIVMTPENIEKGRSSVLEEIRNSENSKGIERALKITVIGDPYYRDLAHSNVVKNTREFKYSAVTDFYRKWYRPDLQALIIIGDIDVTETERDIADRFSDLRSKDKQSANIQPLNVKGFNWQNKVVNLPEVKGKDVYVQLALNIPNRGIKTVEDFRHDIMIRLFNQMMRARFDEYEKTKIYKYNNAPLRFESSFAELGPRFSTLLSRINFKEGSAVDAVMEILTEREKLRRFGFSIAELQAAQETLLDDFKLHWGTTPGNLMIRIMVGFMFDEPIINPSVHGPFIKDIIRSITTEEMNDTVRSWLDVKDNLILSLVNADEGSRTNLTVDVLLNIINAMKASPVTPYVMPVIEKTTVATLLNTDSVKLLSAKLKQMLIKEKSHKSTGIKVFNLPNGSTIIFKPLPDESGSGKVLLKSVYPGFPDELTEKGRFLRDNSAYVVSQSRLGSVAAEDREYFLRRNKIDFLGLSTKKGFEINGYFDSGSFEKVLQSIYLYATKPNADTAVLNRHLAQLKAIKEEPRSAVRIFQDTVSYYVNRREASRSPNINVNVTPQEIVDYFLSRSSVTRGATFIFVGDFEFTDQLLTLIAKYIGNIPECEITKEVEKIDQNLTVKEPPFDIVVNGGKNTNSQVNLHLEGRAPYSVKNIQMLELIKNQLSGRLFDRLRNEEKGIYGVGVILLYDKSRERFIYKIDFNCLPNNVDRLVSATRQEVEKILNSRLPEHIIDSLRTGQRYQIRDKMSDIGFWMSAITDEAPDFTSFENIIKADGTISEITANDLMDFAKKYINIGMMSRYVLNPER